MTVFEDLATLDAPPQDIDAERFVIGAAMMSQPALRDCRDLLADDGNDFNIPYHAHAWRLLCSLNDDGHPTDIAAVLAAARSEGEYTTRVVTADRLVNCQQCVTVPSSALFYAQRVAEAATLRHLAAVGIRIAQMAQQAYLKADVVGVIDDVLTRAHADLADVTPTRVALHRKINGLMTIEEFTDQPESEQNWIIPDLIEQQDVFMILAGEGVGKTVLSRQMVMCVAAGIHPFDDSVSFPARNALLVDLENPTGMARRNMRDGRLRVEALAGMEERGWVWMRPEGLNLRKPSDAALLEAAIAQTRPALVAFGSLYKAFTTGRDSWETAADEVRVVFDRLRARYGCAFWLEHHMPKGDGTTRPQLPIGSSVWQRWVGFGRVLERVGKPGTNAYQLKQTFRGDREPRKIPIGFYRGGDHAMHWVPVWDMTELEGRADKKLS